MSTPRHLEVEDIGDVMVVRFLDKRIAEQNTIHIVGEQIARMVDERGSSKLVLDFANVEAFTSFGVGKLIALHNKVNAVGGKLILCNICPQVYEGLSITALTKILNIQKDVPAALQGF